MTNQPGPQPQGEGSPRPDPDPDSRRVWLDRSDALFGDVPGSPPPTSSPGTGPGLGGHQNPPSGYGVQPPPSRPGSPPVSWPSIDASTAGLERPNWEQWRGIQDDVDPVPPTIPASPRSSQPSLAHRAAKASRRLGGPGWVPVVVTAAVMLMSFGLRPNGMYPGFHDGFGGPHGINQMVGDGPALRNLALVVPIGGEVPALPENPTRVRFEVLAPSGTTGTVAYSSDRKAPQTDPGVALPWAVVADLSQDNSVVEVSASQSASETGATTAALGCRIYLDDQIVVDTRGRGSVKCAVNVSQFRDHPSMLDGAPLAAATRVQPLSTFQGPLPSAKPGVASTVTFEAYSSSEANDIDVAMGPPDGPNKARRYHQANPSAWQAPVARGAGLLSITALDGDRSSSGTGMMCRILLDGVVVSQTVGVESASCTTSVGDVLGV